MKVLLLRIIEAGVLKVSFSVKPNITSQMINIPHFNVVFCVRVIVKVLL